MSHSIDSPGCRHDWPVLNPNPCPYCTLDAYQQEQRNRVLRRQRSSGRHYVLKAETIIVDRDPTLWKLFKRGCFWCWSRVKWNIRCLLRLQRR